ncbi:hypothetical protein BGY98DRAFT_953587 [Russula aff. rugulosa BPL654]|nr:hypothetical protein BGY98DRAFT_953587 [Russula aff. rugulosa BPL654]
MTTTTSFAPSSRSLSGDDTIVSLAALGSARSIPAPDTTTTTTTVIPLSISSPIPTSASPQSPTEYFTGGASTPLLAGLISIGAFALAAITICTWHRFVGPGNTGFVLGQFADWITPARFRRRRVEEEGEAGEAGGQGGAGPEGVVQRRRGRSRRARPQMFDAWIETVDDTFKWEASGSVVSEEEIYILPPLAFFCAC